MGKLAITIIILLSILSCGGGYSTSEDCNSRMNDYILSWGDPGYTEVDENSYWKRTYWYWCRGEAITFTQDGDACEVTTYSFDPICP